MASSVCVCDEYFNVDGDGSLCLIPGQQGLREVLYFKTAGTFQFKKADYPWLARVRVKVQAGGGGAPGAASAANQLVAQIGGAAGGYSESLINVSALGAVETIVVGSGGAAGSANTDGGAGGNSSFGGLVSANEGGGAPQTMESGSDVGAFSGIAGAPPGTGQLTIGGGPGGGSIRLSGFQGQSGEGGNSQLGQGGYQRSSSNPGGAPRGYGAGAAGALARAGDSVGGTAGAGGIVIIELHG
ncbi:hypothetical protein AB0N87_43400 [Streptomyces sp. NPDC093228]|uniref:hypothetical protein n=1 Tax=Streptomyces sp. NPDC093228 TaxID=3155070 RepID=UPI00341840AD